MQRKIIKYTAGEIRRVKIVADILPSPDSLVPNQGRQPHRTVRTTAQLRAMQKRGEIKTDWKAAAKKPLPSRRDADDAMGKVDQVTTKLPGRTTKRT